MIGRQDSKMKWLDMCARLIFCWINDKNVEQSQYASNIDIALINVISAFEKRDARYVSVDLGFNILSLMTWILQ